MSFGIVPSVYGETSLRKQPTFFAPGAGFSKDPVLNLPNPESDFDIKVSRKLGDVLTSDEVHFFSLVNNLSVRLSKFPCGMGNSHVELLENGPGRSPFLQHVPLCVYTSQRSKQLQQKLAKGKEVSMYSYIFFRCLDDIACPLVLLRSTLSRKHNFPDGRILRFLSRSF